MEVIGGNVPYVLYVFVCSPSIVQITQQDFSMSLYMDTSNNSHEGVNDLTLQLLLNARNYRKVMKRLDPEKYLDSELDEIQSMKESILEVTNELISGNLDDYSVDIQKTFHAYVGSIRKHLEMKQIQQDNEYNREQYEIEQMEKYNDNSSGYTPSAGSRSFWGKDRVIKKDW